jgi:hypothetical protein
MRAKEMKMINRYVAIVGIACLWAVPASADIGDALDSMFMTTGTEPSIYQSQRRMGVDFGTLRLRAPVNTYNLVNISPPTIRAGCGGIDPYGGSFTFINTEQFRQMLRQIGANAIGYAFKLALGSMCASCNAELSELQQKLQKWNEININTCKWAKGLVHDFGSSFSEKFKEEHKNKESTMGNVEDTFGAVIELFTDNDEPVNDGHASGANPTDTKWIGNFTWKALRHLDSGSTMGFTPGNLSHEELLMNIAGTFIHKQPDGQGVQTPEIDAGITYLEFRNGKAENSAGTGDANPAWQCNDDDCLDPVELPSWSFPGVGPWASGKLQEIADHYADTATAGTDLSAELQTFVGVTPIPVLQQMLMLQGRPLALNNYVAMADDYVTSMYAPYLALILVKKIERAYQDEETYNMPPNVRANLTRFKDAAEAEMQKEREKYVQVLRDTHDIANILSKSYQNRALNIETAQ